MIPNKPRAEQAVDGGAVALGRAGCDDPQQTEGGVPRRWGAVSGELGSICGARSKGCGARSKGSRPSMGGSHAGLRRVGGGIGFNENSALSRHGESVDVHQCCVDAQAAFMSKQH